MVFEKLPLRVKAIPGIRLWSCPKEELRSERCSQPHHHAHGLQEALKGTAGIGSERSSSLYQLNGSGSEECCLWCPTIVLLLYR